MKFSGYKFCRERPTKPRNYSLIAFDTETESDGSFICGAYYGVLKTSHGNEIISEYCDNLEEFKDKFHYLESRSINRKRGFILVGFNTSYDLIYLGNIVESSSRLDAGSRFIQAKTIRGTKIYDISNHVIGSLDDWINRLNMKETYGIEKRDGYLDSEEGKRAQVLDDAKATWVLADWVQTRLNETFRIPLTPTKFGAALKIFQRHFFKGRWYRNKEEQWKNDLERESYYGGRCEVFRRGKQTVESYDVNSMYVAIMRDSKIPNPTISKYLRNPEQILGLIQTDFLTVDCRVRVPKLRIGLLPYRDTTRDGKLIFPWGEWRGVFNSVELREAMKWGAEIVTVYRALWYPESANYFGEYAQMTLEGRKEAKKNGDKAEEQLYKYFGNGLYGKFAQQNLKGGQFIRLSQFNGDLEGFRIIPGAGDFWVEMPIEGKEDAKHAFPVVSATITAIARAKMLNALCRNAEIAVYCDTDSLKCLDTPVGISIGKEPGQWDFEYRDSQEFYRPKRYANKRKGVPKRAVLIEKTETREVYRFERPTKFRTAIRQHKDQNFWQEEVKVLSLVDDKRVWLADNTSWPLHVYEPEELPSNPKKQKENIPQHA